MHICAHCRPFGVTHQARKTWLEAADGEALDARLQQKVFACEGQENQIH